MTALFKALLYLDLFILLYLNLGGYIEANVSLAWGGNLGMEAGANFIFALIGNLARMNHYGTFEGNIGWSYDAC